jgi:hypothetical protein
MTNDIDSAARRVAIQCSAWREADMHAEALADIGAEPWQHEDRAAHLVRLAHDAVDALTDTDASEIMRREELRMTVRQSAAVALAWLEQIAIEEQR